MLDSTSTKADNPTDSPALIPSLSGPDVAYTFLACIQSYGEPRVISTRHNRRGPILEPSRKAQIVRGIPFRSDDQLNWGPHRSRTSLEAYGWWTPIHIDKSLHPILLWLNASNCTSNHRPDLQVVASSGLDHTTRYERPLARSLLDSRTPQMTCTI